MTVSYTGEAYSAGFGVYLRLLFRYRGSVYKQAWVEFILFGSLYLVVSLVYRLILDGSSKTWLELCIISVSRIMHQIPIGFVLGFYVSLIYGRFWKCYLAVPSPTKTAIFLTTYLHGKDEEAVLMRRTAVRYMCSSFVLALRTMNIPIRTRFPTLQHVGDSGLLTPEELEAYQKIESRHNCPVSFIPLTWCALIVRRAYDKGRIRSSAALVDIIKLIDDFRANSQTLFNYDTINVPLCYTQAVTFACYCYFTAGIVGYQFIPADRVQVLRARGAKIPREFEGGDIFVPIFAIVQFFIYMGLMKVAEALLNPHGENDDDFELCHMVDKNLNNGNMIVTEMHGDLTELCEDMYWDVKEVNIPHTAASEETERHRPHSVASRMGSVFNMEIDASSNQAHIHGNGNGNGNGHGRGQYRPVSQFPTSTGEPFRLKPPPIGVRSRLYSSENRAFSERNEYDGTGAGANDCSIDEPDC